MAPCLFETENTLASINTPTIGALKAPFNEKLIVNILPPIVEIKDDIIADRIPIIITQIFVTSID